MFAKLAPRAAHYPGQGFCLVTFPGGNEKLPEPTAFGDTTFFPTMDTLKSALASRNIALVQGGRVA